MMGGILMKKAIICFVTIFACLILTVGCNTYNAKLYNADNWINNDFAEDNLIRNVYYSQSGSGENVLSDDETYPESRTFIVENSETAAFQHHGIHHLPDGVDVIPSFD